MPVPNIQNRLNFKSYVRHFKDKFTSRIQDLEVSYLDGIFSEKSASLSSQDYVKFILFDNKESIDLSEEISSNNLLYFPSLPGDELYVKFNSKKHKFKFVGEDEGIEYDNDTYTLDESFYIDGKVFTVKALGGVLLSTEDGPTCDIYPSSSTVNEGDSISFDIVTQNIPNNTVLYYDIVGNVTANDFVDSSLTGQITILDNLFTLTKSLKNDLSTEEEDSGVESFYINIRELSPTGPIIGVSSTIYVSNTSYSLLSLVESSLTVNEGSTVSITVNAPGVSDGTTLYYTTTGITSATDFSDSSLTGSFVVNSGISTIFRTLSNDLSIVGEENQEYFQIQIRRGSTSGTIIGTSSTITVQDTSTASYIITESINSINEGENVTFTVETTGISDGTTLYYTTSSPADISPSSGSFTINNNTGSFTVSAINDLEVESSESFNVQVRSISTSGAILATSNNISIVNVPYALSISSDATVTEGNTINFTISTVGIPNSTVLYYTLSGISTADIPVQSGSFTISNNTGTVSITPANDLSIDDNETFTLQIRAGSISGTVISTSTPVTIKDKPFTISITPSTTSIVESTLGSTSTLTFNISTSNINNGTNLKAKINPVFGNISKSDFSPSSFERSFTVSESTISLSWDIVRDVTTEGNEQFNLQILDASNNILATGPTITILDRSFVGSRYDGKTNGPIRVNRDGGVVANLSDWFDICNLDSLPDGSKIALFIDNSGSMTTNTVRASYNLFLQKINEKNMEIIVVENENENWITPFNTILD